MAVIRTRDVAAVADMGRAAVDFIRALTRLA